MDGVVDGNKNMESSQTLHQRSTHFKEPEVNRDVVSTSDVSHLSEEEEEEMPTMSVWMTIGLLVVITVVCVAHLISGHPEVLVSWLPITDLI